MNYNFGYHFSRETPLDAHDNIYHEHRVVSVRPLFVVYWRRLWKERWPTVLKVNKEPENKTHKGPLTSLSTLHVIVLQVLYIDLFYLKPTKLTFRFSSFKGTCLLSLCNSWKNADLRLYTETNGGKKTSRRSFSWWMCEISDLKQGKKFYTYKMIRWRISLAFNTAVNKNDFFDILLQGETLKTRKGHSCFCSFYLALQSHRVCWCLFTSWVLEGCRTRPPPDKQGNFRRKAVMIRHQHGFLCVFLAKSSTQHKITQEL